MRIKIVFIFLALSCKSPGTHKIHVPENAVSLGPQSIIKTVHFDRDTLKEISRSDVPFSFPEETGVDAIVSQPLSLPYSFNTKFSAEFAFFNTKNRLVKFRSSLLVAEGCYPFFLPKGESRIIIGLASFTIDEMLESLDELPESVAAGKICVDNRGRLNEVDDSSHLIPENQFQALLDILKDSSTQALYGFKLDVTGKIESVHVELRRMRDFSAPPPPCSPSSFATS